MRPLKVHDLTFCEFYADVPKYAIASHRWVQDEATFDDIRNRRSQSKSGYKKVRDFAEYVKNNIDGVEWVWVDTCCINKESAAELSEAVNSMFKWYQNAEVCLAYLADVSAGDDINGFKESLWFSRGWTLQELLAPHLVVFLTKEWEIIGHKGDNRHSKSGILLDAGPPLETTIADVTRIPESVSRDYTQSQSCQIERKLSWSNGRKTTRPEDMSYCLFGIFDVSMPVVYGEGEEKARKRLQEAIFKDREAIRKLPTAKEAMHDLYEEGGSARCLEGTRVDILHQIHKWANDADGRRIFWLCGAAGTGKSTISRTVAHNLYKSKTLGASFFFKRGGGDRGHARLFFPTIAFQLASRIHGFGSSLADEISNENLIWEKPIQHQFEKLLLQPSLDIPKGGQSRIVVIDALDECERDTDIRNILTLLARAEALHLRVFVTSRPELPVRLEFKSMAGDLHQDVMLEEVQATTIEHDIRMYFRHRFEEIKAEDNKEELYDELPVEWPGEATIEALVKLAVPLFIFASTACRISLKKIQKHA